MTDASVLIDSLPLPKPHHTHHSTLAKANPLRCCIHVDVEEDAWSHQVRTYV